MTSGYYPGIFQQQVLVNFPTSSYNNFLQAQTLPYQVQTSGIENVCTACNANRYPINLKVTSENDAIPVCASLPLPNYGPIAGVSDGLLGTNVPRRIC
jgi:hypothetical protein